MREFSRGLEQGFATTKRNADEFLLTQARGFIRTVIADTPPGGGGRKGLTAKRAGEEQIEGEVRSTVIPIAGRIRSDKIQLETNLSGTLDRKRNRTNGRIRRNAVKVYARAASINRVIREKKRRVGFLAAGWNDAARLTGARVPAWISRHIDGKGRGRIIFGNGEIRVVMSNATPFVGNVSGLQRRVQRALNDQGRKMQRAAESYYQKQLKNAGFETRG